MGLDSRTGYSVDELNLFTAGMQKTLKDFNSQYGILNNQTAQSTPAVLPQSYVPQFQNIGNVQMTEGMPVGSKVGSLGVITTPYKGSTRYEKVHEAVDIANKKGTPIPAFAGGTVTEVVTGKKHGEKGFGNYVVVQDDQGNYHRYSHLNSAYVPINTKIAKGTVVGEMGATGSTYSNSGQSEGDHLDYRVYDKSGKKLNPFAYIMADYYNSTQTKS